MEHLFFIVLKSILEQIRLFFKIYCGIKKRPVEPPV